MSEEKQKTVLGVEENIEALLCYVLGWVSGLIFLLLEKDNKFVRFHALQSLATFLVLFVGATILSLIPILGILINLVLWPFGLVLWIILMIKAYKGEKFKLPIVGDFAEEQLNK